MDAERAFIQAQTEAVTDENHRKNVDKLLDTFDRLSRHGSFRITFGERLQVEAIAGEPLMLARPRDDDEQAQQSARPYR